MASLSRTASKLFYYARNFARDRAPQSLFRDRLTGRLEQARLSGKRVRERLNNYKPKKQQNNKNQPKCDYNANGVLMKLNMFRHFYMPPDNLSFADKRPGV